VGLASPFAGHAIGNELPRSRTAYMVSGPSVPMRIGEPSTLGAFYLHVANAAGASWEPAASGAVFQWSGGLTRTCLLVARLVLVWAMSLVDQALRLVAPCRPSRFILSGRTVSAGSSGTGKRLLLGLGRYPPLVPAPSWKARHRRVGPPLVSKSCTAELGQITQRSPQPPQVLRRRQVLSCLESAP